MDILKIFLWIPVGFLCFWGMQVVEGPTAEYNSVMLYGIFLAIVLNTVTLHTLKD